MNSNTVSIIIPAFNADGTIAETLSSLKAQTFCAWQAIVVDDGSRDRTLEIAEGFATHDGRFKVIRQENQGESAARNTGLTFATGGLVLFLDADDWILPDYLLRMVAASDHEGADVVHCGWVRVTQDGRRSTDRFAPARQELFDELAQYNCFAMPAACLVRGHILGRVGSFDRSLRTCADWDFWQRLARAGARFLAVPEVLACYRLRPASAATGAYQLLADALTVIARGHAEDPRVINPLPAFAGGRPRALESRARLEFACWAAGLAIGGRMPVSLLLDSVIEDDSSPVTSEHVADVLFEAVPIPTGELNTHWVEVWPHVESGVDDLLQQLEDRLHSAGFALRAKALLMRRIIESVGPMPDPLPPGP